MATFCVSLVFIRKNQPIFKVLENLHSRVRQVYYGEQYRQPLRVERRAGKPRNPHRPDLCQACHDGTCQIK